MAAFGANQLAGLLGPSQLSGLFVVAIAEWSATPPVRADGRLAGWAPRPMNLVS